MSDVLTHRLAGAVSGQHSTKPGFKAWGVSLVGLGLVAYAPANGDIGIVTILHERMHQIDRFGEDLKL